MRLLRLTLLSDFFLKKKNFDRANKIINFGIFLAIFALTSSVISFVIERKINSKEFELIISQNEITQMQVMGSWFKNNLQLLYSDFDQEQRDYETELYLNETKINFKLMSSRDFYEPYIFFTLKEEEVISKLMDEENFIQEFTELLKPMEEYEYVEKSKIDNWRSTLEAFTEKRDVFKKINTEDYNLKNFLTNQIELFDEIENLNSSSDLDYTNQIRYDYTAAYQYRWATINVLQTLAEIFDLLVSLENTSNETISDEILYLSKLEANLILFSFLMQFIIFIIIQLFEISSITRDKKVKLL
tara:strand:+ start:222 stop:1124 length:903 start_codon:yes stop_codon:yes gene_type:complete